MFIHLVCFGNDSIDCFHLGKQTYLDVVSVTLLVHVAVLCWKWLKCGSFVHLVLLHCCCYQVHLIVLKKNSLCRLLLLFAGFSPSREGLPALKQSTLTYSFSMFFWELLKKIIVFIPNSYYFLSLPPLCFSALHFPVMFLLCLCLEARYKPLQGITAFLAAYHSLPWHGRVIYLLSVLKPHVCE